LDVQVVWLRTLLSLEGEHELLKIHDLLDLAIDNNILVFIENSVVDRKGGHRLPLVEVLAGRSSRVKISEGLSFELDSLLWRERLGIGVV
jgi:hypothetical protein